MLIVYHTQLYILTEKMKDPCTRPSARKSFALPQPDPASFGGWASAISHWTMQELAPPHASVADTIMSEGRADLLPTYMYLQVS